MRRITAVMIGSSCDGIDIASFEVSAETYSFLAKESISMPEIWRSRLTKVHEQSAQIFWQTHTYFGQYLGELLLNYHEEHQLKGIECIALHGFTVFHDASKRITFQLGDPNSIAAIANLNVLSDFRAKDVALGGQGAPLTPMLDAALFSQYSATINLGGICNISLQQNGNIFGYDISGCNTLLNRIANRKELQFDEDGRLASMGKPIGSIVETLNSHPFFKTPPPRSLHTHTLVEEFLPILNDIERIEDALATAVEHVSGRIAHSIKKVVPISEQSILVTGGGAYNKYLIKQIQNKLPNHTLEIGSKLLIEFKECLLMAFLANNWFDRIPNSVPSLTRAARPTINGTLTLADL